MPSCAPSLPTPWHRAGSGALSFALRRAWGGGAAVSSGGNYAWRPCLKGACGGRPPLVLPPKWVDASSFGRPPTRPLFAEIQYRGQRPSICESEKRDASGCLRKVLRLPRSVFSRSSCPKLTPHISTVFVHDGAISSKKLSWHIPSWHASRVGLRSAPRRGGIPGGARPRDRAPSCAAAFLRAPSWMRQGVRRTRVRQGFVGQESGDLPHERPGVSSSVATKAGAGGGAGGNCARKPHCCTVAFFRGIH